MKVTINETQFANMLNGLKDFCAKESDERPALQSIYMVVHGATISAYATDGYYTAKMIFDCDPEDWDVPADFTFYIKPFAFKPSKKGVLPVVMTLADKVATVEVTTSSGDTKRYLFKQTEEYPTGLPQTFTNVENGCKDIAIVSIRQMVKMFRSVKKISLDGNATILLGRNGEIIVRPKVEGIEYEQYTFPIKRIGE